MKSWENEPTYIDLAINKGFDVEVDIWYIEKVLYLGHDKPQYVVDARWFRDRLTKLWIHCKNVEAMLFFNRNKYLFNYFWHETDRYTLTSKGIGWVLVGQYPYPKSVIVLPESISLYIFPHGIEYIKNSYGICTDKLTYYSEMYKKYLKKI